MAETIESTTLFEAVARMGQTIQTPAWAEVLFTDDRPCAGCHSAKQAAIAAAEAAIAGAQERIRECETRIGICEEIIRTLRELAQRLRYALARLRAVASDLGETYEAVYNLIRRGGALPHDGRWVTGTGTTG
jgi:hypothetical protein